MRLVHFIMVFGFRDSDLDVCIVFKDGREQNVRILSTKFHVV